MKRPNITTILGALLVMALPLATANAQQPIPEPGTFDPLTYKPAAAPQVATPEQSPLQSKVGTIAVAKTGRVIVPPSSLVRPEDKGLRAHTNLIVFVPQGMDLTAAAKLASPQDIRSAASPSAVYQYAENPGSLGCVYQVGPSYSGCTPSGGAGLHPTGGSGAIAIVDAYHNPDAASDLAYFSSYWGLPAANFTQIYCQPSGGTCSTSVTPPATDTGWALEEALDIEWAHAMAPSAKIFLIEANSSSIADLTWAVAWGGYYVANNGGGEVSNSWGGSEFSNETSYDYYFNNYSGNYNPVVYIASGGDSGTVEWPSASPYVISAGGTTVNRDASGNFVSQTCWSGTGRGVSTVEAIPSYQSLLGGISGGKRSTTDLSFDADPASGGWVYDTQNGGWMVVGGTSLSAPALAGIMNNAGNFFRTSFKENSLLYSEYAGRATRAADFLDVTPTGYDTCTGVGTPRGKIGK